ncbi:hypothetical protein T440DRAFT_38955 [Plenodomus tracheiphilus IPT5]|uniref:Uncharacterized protein n=1 Tax=Plenodomus tracheiphilus IPT5 TaxID=1408161 RepID=A0A6A7BDN5_9PLEO|nr:hypothetical protein T440DRAFT_38955 [Plenodomus tracheiphilus IPT5]
MLSQQTTARLLLSLVLTLIFTVGSGELRVAVGTILSWALGHIIFRRFALPAGARRAFHAYLLLSSVVLSATNDVFYEQTFGRVLDLFFERCSCDPDVPGSGFTDWHETYRRRHKYEIALAWRFVCFAISWIIGLGALFVIIPFVALYKRESREWAETDRAYEWLHRTGEVPPWIVEERERRKAPMPAAPKRDTRYMQLGDDVIYVCGVGGGFERVVAGDYPGAISRRRGISKEFA